MTNYVEFMPEYKKLAPSKESQQAIKMPITVVSRSIGTNSVVDKHSHSWGQFVYANSGVLSVETNENRYIVPPEQGVWVLPEVIHEVTALTDVSLTSFYFDNSLLGKLPKEVCVLKIDSFLQTLILEAKNTAPNYTLAGADGLLLRLIVEKLSIAPNVVFQLPFPKDPRLLKMLSMLQKKPALNHTLKQWGEIVGASSRTLSRLFKLETGLNYREWQKRLNIQIAISLLSNGESVSNISLQLGYESPSAFIHMFKLNTGMTPGANRAR